MADGDAGWQTWSGLATRLGAVPLFATLDHAARAAIAEELEWFSLPGGAVLYAEGDAPEAIFIVLSGLLSIVRGPLARGSDDTVEVRAGESVGEVGLLTGRPHTGSVVALRDSTLATMSRAAFDRLIARYPDILLRLAREIASWSARPAPRDRPPGARRTVALLPVSDEAPGRLARLLKDALEITGKRVTLLDAAAQNRVEEEYDAIELAHDVTIYCGERTASTWSLLCLRRADYVMIVADGGAPPSRPELMVRLEALRRRRIILVLTHESARRLPAPAAGWLTQVPAQYHRHIRLDRPDDIGRLARFLTDRAVGLVLSGGGARAYGHIGVAQALREAGIEFDLLGGTSMGAIVAAGFAHEWSLEELRARMHEAFVTSNPLGDVAIPLLALSRGARVSARLRQNFGASRIEDLWRPYFAVSSNLTTGKVQVHREGRLWRALRASVAIPGLLPPVIEHGEVLVDGAVMNNLPAEVMTAVSFGPVIGVDVGRREDFRPVNRGWLANLILGPDAHAPGMVNILLRAGTIASEAETALSREHVDLLVEPPLDQIGMRDWHSFNRAVEAGYRHAVQTLKNADLSKFRA
ncbi:MAG TPA: patatin-like phospholipase family protein [Stellaceae bacterium]|nr:patatin-like phospholipase family protein [Stellaceae bacterium]